ncbi:hypothetical protein HPP92_022649 [Vanilla planifolia]|uniref:F-box domain-containing protein n=1 Tax=Vanilla planifolia TaxID=51239 RepID=A0A835PPF0_VANPL|nr:hypothetical protein HPP92_022933 [Vanilla planifolia]KAG0459521.1 hypothetical protein HPP92_022649 [Vanilla planifolia]
MALSVSTAGGDRLVRGKDGGCEEISSIAFSSPPALLPPSHLFARVFSQLDCIDLLNCSLVCKQWHMDTAELRNGWKNEYLEAFNTFAFLD